jgi:hypothetical protein
MPQPNKSLMSVVGMSPQRCQLGGALGPTHIGQNFEACGDEIDRHRSSHAPEPDESDLAE